MTLFSIRARIGPREQYEVLAMGGTDFLQLVSMLERDAMCISYTVSGFGIPPMTAKQYGVGDCPKWCLHNWPKETETDKGEQHGVT